jgi:hypothetical protein
MNISCYVYKLTNFGIGFLVKNCRATVDRRQKRFSDKCHLLKVVVLSSKRNFHIS